MSERFRFIGKALERQEAPDKVTGRAVYAGDIYLPGMLHGAVLRSPYGHARILKIDTAAALAQPGVHAVITAADLPGLLIGECIKDQPVLAGDRVRFAGERVAAVAAEEETIARYAAELISVEYEPLPAVFEIDEALHHGAPLVHDELAGLTKAGEGEKGNVYAYKKIARGSIDAGWAQSDYIYEDTFSTQSVHQGYTENHAAVAMVEPDGSATIWSSNKTPFRLRQQLAAYAGINEDRIRVISPVIGGDFGGKGAVMDEPLCYYLSRVTGRPVRIAMRRSEELSSANPRHPALIKIKSGLKKNGELVARQVSIYFNSGAYGGVKPNLLLEGHTKTAGPYRIPHVLIEGHAVYTHNDPCGHCRAPGHPQAVFAVESHMDILAGRLGMDPLQFRLLNVLKEGEEAPTGEKWRDMRGREVLEHAARLGGWHGPRPEGTGLGLALAYRATGGGESGAVITISDAGSVELLTGTTETGAGPWTAMRQIAAEELGVDPNMIRLTPGNTSSAPRDSGSGASRVTHVGGWAASRAAGEALSVMKNVAAEMLNCSEEEITAKAGEFWRASQPVRRLSFKDVAAKACEHGPVICRASYEGRNRDRMAFAAHIAEVRVDRHTGAVEVVRIIAVHDIGCAVNPPAAEGQVEGSVVQGLGHTLWEELAGLEGRLRSPFLSDYHQPTCLDMPRVEVIFLEGAPGPAPFGGKGIGEVPIVPVAAAIANALEDAAGVRIKDLPLTPEKVWRALRAEEGY